MSYTIEKVEGETVLAVAHRATERQALYFASYQPSGEFRVRQGDRLVLRISVSPGSAAAGVPPEEAPRAGSFNPAGRGSAWRSRT